MTRKEQEHIVAEVGCLRPEPGDLLVVKLEGEVAPEERVRMREWMRAEFPEQHVVFLIGGALELWRQVS